MNNDKKDILVKRFQTTMIGALHEFEKSFGYLWGQHKSDDQELTDNELKFLDLWDETRNRILNNGNNQMRKAIVDLENITGTTKYTYRFYKKGSDQ